jgi:hypothetical protein
MRMVLDRAGGDRFDIHQQPPVFDFRFEAGHPVVFETGLAFAGDVMELVIVPGTDDVVALEAAFAQGTAGVIAGARDDGEGAIHKGHGKAGAPHHDLLQGNAGQLLGQAEVVPLWVGHGASTGCNLCRLVGWSDGGWPTRLSNYPTNRQRDQPTYIVRIPGTKGTT